MTLAILQLTVPLGMMALLIWLLISGAPAWKVLGVSGLVSLSAAIVTVVREQRSRDSWLLAAGQVLAAAGLLLSAAVSQRHLPLAYTVVMVSIGAIGLACMGARTVLNHRSGRRPSWLSRGSV